MTWIDDGRILVVSSFHGFCSVIAFDKGELGREFVQNPRKSENISNKIDLSKPIIEIHTDKIISVDQKIASREKKDKPVTPIEIRRHPRISRKAPTPKTLRRVKFRTTSTPKSKTKILEWGVFSSLASIFRINLLFLYTYDAYLSVLIC